ncbi:MAG: hypothetical protein LV473_11995, partial [Nitrospira sp.]|nr:hypothetical protein [Nitrospira sp.]
MAWSVNLRLLPQVRNERNFPNGMYKTRHNLNFVMISFYSDRPISGLLATCFDYNDLASDFGPIAQHT